VSSAAIDRDTTKKIVKLCRLVYRTTRHVGPETVMENVTLGRFTDPEGHVIGLTQGYAVLRRWRTHRCAGGSTAAAA
jgi:hypothetical protein